MTEKRIVVPEGMLVAALGSELPALWTKNMLLGVLTRALRWLSDNPIEPTKEQVAELVMNAPNVTVGSQEYPATRHCITEWQRRMFLAPDPDEPIKDLIDRLPTAWPREEMITFLREALRRGQKGAK